MVEIGTAEDALGPSVFELKLQAGFRTAGTSSTDHVLRKERNKMSVWEIEEDGYMGQGKRNLKAIPRHKGEIGQVRTDAKELVERPKHLSEKRQRGERARASERGAQQHSKKFCKSGCQ